MFASLETALLETINVLPLEWFVFIASFIEEVFAPIPSLSVLLATGSFAAIQDRPLSGLVPLALIAALGKTIGAVAVYYLADRFGGLFLTKFGRFFDITPSAIRDFGDKIDGRPRSYVLLTLFRALPVMPSSVISIGCGLLKINLRLFLTATIIGTIVRDSIFLYIGYTGTQLWSSLAYASADIESLVQVIGIISVGLVLLYLYSRRKRKIVQE